MKVYPFVLLLLLAVHSHAQETIKLESTISGNQEQPQVLYMLPWKVPDSPALKFDALNRPFRDVFEHVERDELRRELQSSVMIKEPLEGTVESSN